MSVQVHDAIEAHDLVEHFIKMLIQQEVQPSSIMSGIHNAFVHGDILTECHLDFTEKQLEEMFQHFDGLIKIMKAIEDED